MSNARFALLLALIALAALPTRAHAQYSNVAWEATNGAGTCQGALPAFAGTLRARPLAIGNEGTAPAFVTCSVTDGAGSETPTRLTYQLSIRLLNSAATSTTVTCTLVDGYQDVPGNATGVIYLPKAVVVGAGGGAYLTWTGIETRPNNFGYFVRPNLSCALPSSIAIAYVTTQVKVIID